MEYQKQINTFVNYFKNAESNKEDHKIGVEFEHLILNQDLSAVTYFENQGIEMLLQQLSRGNWEKIFEGDNLIGLKNSESSVTLEPGGQLELSIVPFASLKQIKTIYLDFIEKLTKILNEWNQKVAVLGYQPKSSIKDIPLLPKKRYDLMYKYLKNTGKYAHNMMQGTASVQISIDYTNEEDYIKKMRAAYFLSPLIYYLFDNTPFFEGKKAADASIREAIWSNCDGQRSGTIAGIFDKNFGYREYAEYLLNVPPIIRKKKGKLFYTADKPLKKVMVNNKKEEVEHFLSMVFPDVRTKKYIEIRAADALPYPYNFAFAALMKGIFYSQKNLNDIYQKSLNYNQKEFLEFKKAIINEQNNEQRKNLIKFIIQKAKKALPAAEKEYLKKLEKITEKYGPMKFKSLNNLKKGKKKALSWCIYPYSY